jgi:flagellar biosynthesis protein FliQ
MRWLIIVLVVLLYVHLFNALVQIPDLTLGGLWRRFFPTLSLRLEL